MILMNKYIIIEILIFLIAFFILIICFKRNNNFSIKKIGSLKIFIWKILIALLVGIIGVFIHFTRGMEWALNFPWKNVLFGMQCILSVIFETILISSWMQCFYSYFTVKIWGYILIFLWISNQLMGIIPNIIIFGILTIMSIWILKKPKQ